MNTLLKHCSGELSLVLTSRLRPADDARDELVGAADQLLANGQCRLFSLHCGAIAHSSWSLRRAANKHQSLQALLLRACVRATR
jgi:hypothetical protein